MEPYRWVAEMNDIARSTKQIGTAIRRRRRRIQLTQSALGRKAGLRQATISALERGEPGTELRTLMDVMTALDLELVIRARTEPEVDIEDIF